MHMLSEHDITLNDICIYNAEEWDRFFAWCDFLAPRDGAYALYSPLVETLRPHIAGINK